MRTLRLALVGASISVLLGGLSAVAAEADSDGAAERLASMSCEELEAAADDASALDPAVELARRCISCEELDAAGDLSADVPFAVYVAAIVVHGERCDAVPADTLAQSDGERSGTFTVESVSGEQHFEYDVDENGAYTIARTMMVDASDPRLSGTWTEDWICRHGFGHGSGFEVCAGSVRVENEGGTWLGWAEGISLGAGTSEWTVLEGQGGYAGLTAIELSSVGLRRDIKEGVILDFEIPARPELPAD